MIFLICLHPIEVHYCMLISKYVLDKAHVNDKIVTRLYYKHIQRQLTSHKYMRKVIIPYLHDYMLEWPLTRGDCGEARIPASNSSIHDTFYPSWSYLSMWLSACKAVNTLVSRHHRFLSSLRLRQNDRKFLIFLKHNCFSSIPISPKCVTQGPINDMAA